MMLYFNKPHSVCSLQSVFIYSLYEALLSQTSLIYFYNSPADKAQRVVSALWSIAAAAASLPLR